MKKTGLILVLLTLAMAMNALGILRVESIKLLPPEHMNIKVYDADGKYAPLLIVKTELRGLGFQNVSRPTRKAAEYIAGDHHYKFYMNDNQRVVKITHADYEPLEIRLLADFGIEVKAQRVYELTLAFTKEVVQIPMVITANQNGASVFIDDKLIGKTQNKMLTINIGSGYRKIKITKDGFVSQTITQEITTTNNSFNFTLTPAMPAAVTITTKPEGATVYIDGLKFGTTPKSSFFEVGTYPIKI